MDATGAEVGGQQANGGGTTKNPAFNKCAHQENFASGERIR